MEHIILRKTDFRNPDFWHSMLDCLNIQSALNGQYDDLELYIAKAEYRDSNNQVVTKTYTTKYKS